MTQPAPAPSGQPNILMRRIGPLPLLVWLLILILVVFAVIVWRRRKSGAAEGDSLAASDLETSGAVLANPNLFTYPQSVYLYRDDGVDTPSTNDDDDTNTPAPTTPTPTTPSTDPFEAQRWFNTKPPYQKYTAVAGDDWFSVYDKFKTVIARQPSGAPVPGAEGGPWNLFLYNHGRLNMSQADWPSSTVNDPNGKKIPAGTVIAIPLKSGGGMGTSFQSRTRTMATQRAMSDLQLQGPGSAYKTSSTMGRAIPG